MRFQRRGGRKRIVAPDGSEIAPTSKPQPDGTRVKALARAWRWRRVLDDGVYASVSEIGDAENISKSYVSRKILRAAGRLLAPDLVEAILAGSTDQVLMLEKLEQPLPACWQEQSWLAETRDGEVTVRGDVKAEVEGKDYQDRSSPDPVDTSQQEAHSSALRPFQAAPGGRPRWAFPLTYTCVQQTTIVPGRSAIRENLGVQMAFDGILSINQRPGFASVLWSSCLAMLAVGANGTAIMAALPTMQTELFLSSAGVQWAVNAYLVASAACIVLGGQAADRFGARLAWTPPRSVSENSTSRTAPTTTAAGVPLRERSPNGASQCPPHRDTCAPHWRGANSISNTLIERCLFGDAHGCSLFGQGALRWEPSINQFATSWPPLSENPGAAVAITGASSLVVYYPLALMINAPFIWLSLLKIAIVTVILASGLLFFRRWARSLPGVPAPEPVEIRDLQQVIREVKTRVSQFEHVTGGNLNQDH